MSQSEWIQDVLHGMEYQMGYGTQVDHGVPAEALVQVIEHINIDTEACDNEVEVNEL